MPLPVAVLGCEPLVVVIGPMVQVAMCLLLLAEGTVKVKGAVNAPPSPSCQAQLARLTKGSVTFTEVNATSPVFSTVMW